MARDDPFEMSLEAQPDVFQGSYAMTLSQRRRRSRQVNECTHESWVDR